MARRDCLRVCFDRQCDYGCYLQMLNDALSASKCPLLVAARHTDCLYDRHVELYDAILNRHMSIVSQLARSLDDCPSLPPTPSLLLPPSIMLQPIIQ